MLQIGQLVCGPLSLIDEIIDRSECCFPDWFVPLARGAAVASEKLLRDVGYRPGMPRTGHWFEFRPNCCTRLGFDCLSFEVRKCEGTNLWTVERHNIDGGRHDEEVLVLTFGSTLIVTGICKSAKQLAVYCHEHAPPCGLRWVKRTPTNVDAAIELARQRRIKEALAVNSAQPEGRLH